MNKPLLLIFVLGVVAIWGMGIGSAIGVLPNNDSNSILYYHLNNNSAIGENSTLIVDSLGLSNSIITLANFNWTSGIIGDGALEFNGANMRARSISNSFLNFSSPISYGIWFKVNNVTANQEIINFGDTSANGNMTGINYNAGNIKAYWRSGGTTQDLPTYSGVKINQWHYAVFTYNLTDISLYLDGVLVSNRTVTISPLAKLSMALGSLANANGNWYNGTLDELIIYNYSLNQSQIWNNYRTYISCITPYNQQRIGGSISLCSGDYSLNSSLSSTIGLFSLQLEADNLFFDCNSSSISGNWSIGNNLDYRGISLNGRKNVTINNCKFNNYKTAYNFYNSNNISILNSISNNTYTSITLSGTNSSLINNNTFTDVYDVRHIFLLNGINNIVSNNRLEGIINPKGGVTALNQSNLIINNNVIINVSENFTLGSIYAIRIYGYDVKNIIIRNNNISKVSDGIGINTGDNISILDNIIDYTTTDTDSYNVGISVDGGEGSNYGNISNVIINNNTIKNAGTLGIMVRISSNVTISNNYIDFMSSSDQATSPVRDGGEVRCAINVLEIYRTYLGDSTENLTEDNRTNKIGRYKSNNISLIGNSFGPNVQCYLQSQGTSNLNHDLSSYWLVSHQVPTFLVDRTDIYGNLAFENFTSKNRTNGISDYLSQGYGNNELWKYKLHQNWRYYNNNYSSISQFNMYSLTSALVYTSNGSAQYGSGNINITLSPNNSSYVLDNFNVTEGESRQYSPIWFSSTSSTSKHIASNLTQTITTSVTINGIDCDTIGTIVYVSNSSNYTQTWKHGSYTCADSTITFANIPIEPAANSNEFRLSYNQAIQGICQESDATFMNAVSLVGVILSIILIAAVITILFLSFSGIMPINISMDDFDFKTIVGGVLIVGLTGLILATMAYLVGGSYCTAIGG